MPTKKNIVRGISAIAIAGISSAYANEKNPDDFHFTFSLAGISAPRYSGSNEQNWGVFPLFHIQKDNIFLDSVNGLGIHLQSDNGLFIEPALGYDPGRTDKNSGFRPGSKKLKGMGDISPAVNSSITVGWAATSWLVFEGKAILPLSESHGVSYSTSINYIPIMDDDNSLILQTSALFGDSRFINTWYGVNRTQSANSGYDRYNGSAGFYGADTSLTLTHQFSEHWGGLVSVNYTWLDKNAANSPIVKQRGGTTGTLAISYTF